MSRDKKRAVFLDRDGTLIEDNGYLREPSEIAFFPETFEALRKLRGHFLLFIVTNQPWVARGIISAEDVNRVNRAVVDSLGKAGIEIIETYVCPHERSDNCVCIKPKPYFLNKAAGLYGLDLSKSFTVGDHPHDVEFGRNAGGRGIYLLTGHGQRHLAEVPQDTEVAAGIMEAAEKIASFCQARA